MYWKTQTVAKHPNATLKKMTKDENCHLFLEDVKKKVTKLDFDTPNFSKKRRTPTRSFWWKSST